MGKTENTDGWEMTGERLRIGCAEFRRENVTGTFRTHLSGVGHFLKNHLHIECPHEYNNSGLLN